MKLPFTIYDSRFTILKESAGPVAFNRQSSIGNHKSQRGIALIITLILLAVVLVMAIAFLAISRREQGSVVTSTDTATARLAADSALANAEAQIIANALSTTNPFNFGLLVSTNYINANGFTSGSANPTNVNYDHEYNVNTPLTSGELLQNVANLFYLPRPPVFIPNQTNSSGPSDFRFYLDLNRNGQFEDTRADVPNVEVNGVNIFTNGTIPEVGDPQWVGILERPDTTHGPNNHFLSRYAFVAVPVGNTLDINYIHNQALHGNTSTSVNPPPAAGDTFFRNQGVGSWEINLAAFLADLNTNEWDPPNVNFYQYNPPPAVGGDNGYAFEDARALLAFRYDNNYGLLPFLSTLLPNYPLSGPVDIFPFGAAMTGLAPPFYSYGSLNFSWAGADNTNHFFTTQDLFDPSKTEMGVIPAQVALGNDFSDRLIQVGTNVSTYNRYTFYRLLSQLGTDSAPEENKINLNYDNLDVAGNVIPNGQTNFIPWTPTRFFTAAADRMLHLYTTTWFKENPSNYLATYYNIHTNYSYTDSSGVHIDDPNGLGLVNTLGVPNIFGLTNDAVPSFGITNIPVYVNGQFVYSPAVNRVLQLAANIYDATTNKTFFFGEDKDYPSVFRPTFWRTNENGFANVYINGYEFISPIGGQTLTAGIAPLDSPIRVIDLPLGESTVNYANGVNVYGVPWIIGAKKGFPNFNEFSMQDAVQITRKLQISRPNTNSLPTATNQMYIFSITNSLGAEFWNSYTNGYSNQVQIVVNDNLSMQMSNGASSTFLGNPYIFQFNQATNIAIWPGNSFVLPLYTNITVLTNSVYDYSGKFIPVAGNPIPPTFANITPSFFDPFPQTLLYLTNRLQAYMLDNNHIIDYVHLTGPVSVRDLTSEFQNTNAFFSGNDIYYTNGIWSLFLNGVGIPLGIQNQIDISDGGIGLNTTYWTDPQAKQEIDGFRRFLNPTNTSLYGTQSNFLYSTNLAVQVPYTPTVTTYEYETLQVNDPLVHYLQSDLNYSGYDPDLNSPIKTGVHQASLTAPSLPILPDIGRINARYQPWGTNPPPETGISQSTYDENPYNLALKDPLVTSSDKWDFPINKFPTVGWLGRVHRGTPWQTVYLKASNILKDIFTYNGTSYLVGPNTWTIWVGDNNTFDATNTSPIQDRLLFDIFSTAPNDNATRGQLSVNTAVNTDDPAAGLAAWSALFSGMVALTNTTIFPLYFPQTNLPVIIQPAGSSGTNSVLGQIITAINRQRAAFTNGTSAGGSFKHVGDILSTLQLTESSPLLNTNSIFSNGKVLPGSQQLLYGISDEMYEWMPQQAMSLLRASGAPRYVIYSYGQTLKPAPGGIVTSGGGFFGMVTNYQITAETATRTVVRVDGVTDPVDGTPLKPPLAHPHIVIESFNILPPD